MDEQQILQPQQSTMEIMSNNSTSGETAHIDELISSYEVVEKEVEVKQLVSSGSLIDKQGFKAMFFGTAEFVRKFKPEYKSLQMLDENDPQAVAAIETLHDCIMDVPQLHWLLNPGGKWGQRAFALGMFFVPFGFALYADIKQPKIQNEVPRPNEKEHIKVNLEDFK